MPVPSGIRDVFDYFQNLNLLAVVQDLRDGRAARQAWVSGSLLCPVAHGLPADQQTGALAAMGQAADLGPGCDYAARHLGADPAAVLRFVRGWDDGSIGRAWLLRQLEDLWAERLADADVMQELLQDSGSAVEVSSAEPPLRVSNLQPAG